jgi:hypothetical protein
VYAASANGGVFRSDDGGVSWKGLMDGFDLAPTEFASTSLACGAIAIDEKDPDRVYVGTGEGDTYAMFKNRLVNAMPASRGVGPIRSDHGGSTWKSEATAAGSPELAGQAFFALAGDPSNRENVVGATSEGLYQRVAAAAARRSGSNGARACIAASGQHSRTERCSSSPRIGEGRCGIPPMGPRGLPPAQVFRRRMLAGSPSPCSNSAPM